MANFYKYQGLIDKDVDVENVDLYQLNINELCRIKNLLKMQF